MHSENLFFLAAVVGAVVTKIDLVCAGKDYYKILGVPRDAKNRQVKKAFRRLAIKYHPDKNKEKDAEAKFREIAEGIPEWIYNFMFVVNAYYIYMSCF